MSRKREYARQRKSFILIAFLIAPFMIVLLPFSEHAEATVPFTGTVIWPGSESHNRWVGSSSGGTVGIEALDMVYTNVNPEHNTDYAYQKILAGSFGDKLASRNPYGTYFDYYGINTSIPLDATIVDCVIGIYPGNDPSTGVLDINPGWFSVLWTEEAWTDYDWWFYTPGEWNDEFTDVIPFRDDVASDVYNSSLMPFSPHNSTLWNITSFVASYDLNVSKLESPYFKIIWNHGRNHTGHILDYMGFYYRFEWGTYIPTPPAVEMFQENASAIEWLLVTYLPVIVIANVIPKFGYVVGMGLMLLIFGFSQAGYITITIVGLINLGVVMYKGG